MPRAGDGARAPTLDLLSPNVPKGLSRGAQTPPETASELDADRPGDSGAVAADDGRADPFGAA
jgi:hypothetical protein